MKTKTRIRVCPGNQPEDGSYERLEVLFMDEPSSVVVFRFEGTCLAYLNRCVHMQRGLDCEDDTIFDDSGENLRCSMHGVLYEPATGEAISRLCQGEKLTAVDIEEDADGVWICDKRVKPIQRVD